MFNEIDAFSPPNIIMIQIIEELISLAKEIL